MKTLGEYIEIYKEIANRVGVRGESVNLLSQLLANATYLNVSENISFLQESSFSRATLMNSKIQHCMDNMYSVFRGNNPRVYVNYESNSYAEFRPYDLISSSSNFKVYFEGYLKEDGSLERSDLVVPPGNKVVLVGIISRGISTKEWTLSSRNTYYVDFLDDDLSSDLFVSVGNEDELYPVTRSFSDHVEGDLIFDLTLPNFGSRLYLPQKFRLTTGYRSPMENMRIKINAFQYCKLDEFKENELSRLSLTSGIINPFTEDHLLKFDYDNKETHNFGGVIFFKESERDSITTIHYRASRDRFINSSLRSNSDIGRVLEEDFTDKIHPGATSFEFKTIDTTQIEEVKNTVKFSLSSSDGNSLPLKDNVRDSVETVLEKVSFSSDPRSNEKIGLISYGGKSISETTTFNQKLFVSRIRYGQGKILDNGKSTIVQNALKIPLTPDSKAGKRVSGELRVIMRSPIDRKDPESLGMVAVYSLEPSLSIVKVNINGSSGEFENPNIRLTVIKKRPDGGNKVISTYGQLKAEGLEIKYKISSSESSRYSVLGERGDKSSDPDGLLELNLATDLPTSDPYSLDRVYLLLTSNQDNRVLNLNEEECITILKTGSSLSMRLQENTIYIPTKVDGTKVEGYTVKNKVSLFKNKAPLSDDLLERVEIQVIDPEGVTSEIGEDGSIIVSGLPNTNDDLTFVVMVKLEGESISDKFTIKTTGSLFGSLNSTVFISGDNIDSVNSMVVRPEIQEFTVNIEDQNHVYIYSPEIGFDIFSVIWSEITPKITDHLNSNKKFIPSLNIYYAPKNMLNLISDEEIAKFKERRLSYYVTNDINIDRGRVVKAQFIIDAKLYRNESISEIVKYIVDSYSYKFNFNIESKLDEIRALISKIENVKVINSIKLKFSNELNDTLTWEEVEKDLKHTYFTTSFLLNTSI